jgi:6-phosphogluconolactonase
VAVESASHGDLAFIGCLTRPTPYFPNAHGAGILLCRFDAETGALVPIRACTGIENPAWLTVDSDGARLFVCSEVFEWGQGRITAYQILEEDETTFLAKLSERRSCGSITAYASLDRSGTKLLVANYCLDAPNRTEQSAVAVFPIAEDGGLRPASARLSHDGFALGPNAARQERPHAHAVLASPDNRFLLVVDLGIDSVLSYRFDAVAGTVAAEPVAILPMNPGAGPRHLAFHPNGLYLYVINELNSTIAVLAFQSASGNLELLQCVSTLPPASAVANDACAIELTPDGRFLYATNRGHDSVAIFAVDPASGWLTAKGHVASGGRTPRCLAIDPDGRFALVANQNGDNIAVFRIDRASGALTLAPPPVAVGTPMCIAFLCTNRR